MERRLRQRDSSDLDLPDDVLADVLRHLPPRCLAVSRCVSKAWRRAIDQRRLLRPDLLPLSLAGIFMNFGCHTFSEFFSRPSSSCKKINAKLDFLPPIEHDPYEEEDYTVFEHCNGLLLTSECVVNPATRRWDPLPPLMPFTDPMGMSRVFGRYLAFDPTLSPHYQVFRVPYLPPRPCQPGDRGYRGPEDYVDPLVDKSEWPPSTFILNVFSSKSCRWEERSFARQGNAAGIVAELRLRLQHGWHYGAVYWRRALYVHSQNNFFLRISLTDDTYRVIKPPTAMDIRVHSCLGKSKKGVYIASFIKDVFRVWVLNESYGQTKWVLKGEYDLKRVQAFDNDVHGPWVLEDINYDSFRSQLPKANKKARVEEFEWSSENDDDDDDDADDKSEIIGENNYETFRSQLPEVNKKAMVQGRLERMRDNEAVDGNEEERHRACDVLGFHPYKEILFLSSFKEREWKATVHAYHLNSSRVECLGNMCPTQYQQIEEQEQQELGVREFFPYTPCWTGDYPRNK
ncbi:uncharacterized protein [Triticum aestivum]|uniref:uncharacterized protein n=1 Tax=Triticum aestivum TaxID=4565 RepID=UPI000844C762|nr:uncharacterized protein LOC123097200 [Triticum aestivum]